MSWFLAKVILGVALIAVVFTLATNLLSETALVEDTGPLPIHGHVAVTGDWAVGCDNVGRCSAIGMPAASPQGDADQSLRMGIIQKIDGAAGAIDTIEFFPLPNIPNSGYGQFTIDQLPADRGRVFRFDYQRTTLPSEAAFALVKMLQQGDEILGVNDNGTNQRIHFPHAGSSRVFSSQAQQQASNVAAPVDAAAISPQPIDQSDPMPDDAGQICENQTPAHSVEHYVLPDKTWLINAHCADNRSLWYQRLEPNQAPQPLLLHDENGNEISALENAQIDQERGLLSVTAFSDNHADCGEVRSWAATDLGWVPLEHRVLPICGTGLPPSDWIRTYWAGCSRQGAQWADC